MDSYTQRTTIPDQKGGGYGPGVGKTGSPKGPASPQNLEYSDVSDASASESASDSVQTQMMRRGRETKVSSTPWRQPRGKSHEPQKVAAPWRKPRERSLDSQVDERGKSEPQKPAKKIPPWAQKMERQKLQTLVSVDDSTKQTQESTTIQKKQSEKKISKKDMSETTELQLVEDSSILGVKQIQEKSSKSVPWTQEPIKLKKAVTEKKPVEKEQVESVQLKPVKTTKPENAQADVDDIPGSLVPGQVIQEESDKPKLVPWIQEGVKLKKPEKKDLPQETLKDDKPKVIPWTKEEVKLKKAVPKDRQPEDKETTTELPDKDLPQKPRSVPWTQEQIKLKKSSKKTPGDEQPSRPGKVADKPEELKDTDDRVPKDDKSRSVPWTEEQVKLKKAVTEKKVLEKEKLETVQLKPMKKSVPACEQPEAITTPLDKLDETSQGLDERDTTVSQIADKDEPQKPRSVPWTQEQIKLKKPSAEKTPSQPGTAADKPEELKETDDHKETTVSQLPDKDVPQKPKSVPWTQEQIKLKKPSAEKTPSQQGTADDKPEELEGTDDHKPKDDKQKAVPWTEEQVKLKKGVTEKKVIGKEKLETVQLKPMKKSVPASEQPEALTTPLDKLDETSKGLDEGETTVSQIADKDEPQKPRSVPWTQEQIKLKKPSAEKTPSQPGTAADKPEELKETDDHKETTVSQLPDKDEPQKPRSVPWTQEQIKLKKPSAEKTPSQQGTAADKPEELKETDDHKPKDDKQKSVPWTEEHVKLKKGVTEKKVIGKEKLETVQLKPMKKSAPASEQPEAITTPLDKLDETSQGPEKSRPQPGEKPTELNKEDISQQPTRGKGLPWIKEDTVKQLQPQLEVVEQKSVVISEKVDLEKKTSSKDYKVHQESVQSVQELETRTLLSEEVTTVEDASEIEKRKTITPWTQEQVKLKKTETQKKVIEKEKQDTIELKPRTKQSTDDKPILENVGQKDERPEQTEEDKEFGKPELSKRRPSTQKPVAVDLESPAKPFDEKTKKNEPEETKPKVLPWTQEKVKLKKVPSDKIQKPDNLSEKRLSLTGDETKPWTEEKVTLRRTSIQKTEVIEDKRQAEEKEETKEKQQVTVERKTIKKEPEQEKQLGKPKKPVFTAEDTTMLKISFAIKDDAEQKKTTEIEEEEETTPQKEKHVHFVTNVAEEIPEEIKPESPVTPKSMKKKGIIKHTKYDDATATTVVQAAVEPDDEEVLLLKPKEIIGPVPELKEKPTLPWRKGKQPMASQLGEVEGPKPIDSKYEGPIPLKRVPVGGEKLDVVKVEDLPKFMPTKLKKVVCKHGREQPVSKVPKVQLKSRLRHHQWPPTVFNLRITELEPIYVDNGVLSRTYEEAKQVKKTKRRRAKLPEKPETTLEKYEPYEEPQKQAEEPVPDQPGRVKDVKPKPKPAEPEEQKLVMGKGKVPQLEEEKEEVKLKKVPRKEPEEKADEVKKPKQPKPEKPLQSEPGVDYRLKLKPLDDIPTSEGPGPDEMPIPQKDDDETDEVTPGKPKTSKDKPKKQPAPEEERKLPLGKGKPKPEPAEEDIKLRKKQGPPKEEEPESIKLKPWKKDKPAPEETPKELEGPTPKPFPRDEEEELVEPESFDGTDKMKKKRKPKKKSDDTPELQQGPDEEEMKQPFEETDDSVKVESETVIEESPSVPPWRRKSTKPAVQPDSKPIEDVEQPQPTAPEVLEDTSLPPWRRPKKPKPASPKAEELVPENPQVPVTSQEVKTTEQPDETPLKELPQQMAPEIQEDSSLPPWRRPKKIQTKSDIQKQESKSDEPQMPQEETGPLQNVEPDEDMSLPPWRRKKKPASPVTPKDTPQEDKEQGQPKDDKPKKTKKPKPAHLKEFPFEGPLPLKVVQNEPKKVDIVKVDDLPLFSKMKLKKALPKPKKEMAPPSIPKIHLKSRISRHEWPPVVYHLTVSELEPVFVDNGIVSRNYEEARTVKKTKRRKAKLPEKPETTLEKYEPYEEPLKQAEEPVPDQPGRVKDVKPKSKPSEPEQQKLVMGKGKVPQLEEEKEEVKLKKVPHKKPEEKADEVKKPKEPKPEKPLQSEPGVDYRLKLKPLDDIPSSEGPGPDEMPIPRKDDDAPEEITPGKPKKSKDKPQTHPTPEEERKIPLGKGKPKPEPAEEDIKLRKKQGPPKEEEPESIKLKPWKKDKPAPEETPKELEGPTPKPFPRDEDEELVEPESFDGTDKTKKKRKPKKKSDDTPELQQGPDEEEMKQPFEETDDSVKVESETVIEESPSVPPWRRKSTKPAVQPDSKPVEDVEQLQPTAPEVLEDTSLPPWRRPKKTKTTKPAAIEPSPEEQQSVETTEEIASKKKRTPKKPKSVSMKEFPFEGPLPLKVINVKAEKVVIIKVEDLPLFAKIKLKKAPPKPKKEVEQPQVPKIHLKSRIVHHEWPPKVYRLTVTELQPIFVDNGIVSRNYEEAKTIKKTKRRRAKLPEKPENTLEKYEPYEEPQKQAEEPTPDQPGRVKDVKPKPKPGEPEERKLVMGKGKVPQLEEEKEEIKLKKVPRKEPEEKPDDAKKPKQPKPEKPLQSEPGVDYRLKLKPLDDIPTSEGPGPDKMPIPEKDDDAPEEITPGKPKTSKDKPQKQPATEEERKLPLGKGKPKPEPTEEDIKLRKKQGPPKEEEPESIKLKPWKKDKPTPEETPKVLDGPKPKPIPRDDEEELVEPETFDDSPDKKKKKRKPKKKPDEHQGPEDEETKQPFEETDDSVKVESETVIEETPSVPPWRRKSKPAVQLDVQPVEEVEQQQPASPEVVEDTNTSTLRRKKKTKTSTTVPDSEPAPDEEEAPETRAEETPKKKKVTKKPKSTLLKEFPFEGPLPLNVVSVKPEKVEIVKVEDLPLFAKIKLKKAPAKPKKEVEQPKVPKIHLKSRIVHHEWPPIVHHLTIADLEPVFVDNAVVSRNYEEAKQVKKTKRRRAKLPEKPETTLEKYEPYEEPQKQAEEPVPDQPGRVKDVKPKPKPGEPEQQKLVMGKGKVPQLEEEKEEVKLKKVPRKEPEEKTDEVKKPKQPKPEKPLQSEPGVDYRLKLKPLDDIPSSEGPGPDQMPVPQKDDDAPEEITPGEPKTSKDKPQTQPAPGEERKIPLGKGKPKPEPTEEDIKLRKKQGPPKEEEPESIKLKPWKKDKPTPEETPKELEGPKPKPFPRDDEEELVEPDTFDDTPDKKKKKRKPKKKPDEHQGPDDEETKQPFEDTDDSVKVESETVIEETPSVPPWRRKSKPVVQSDVKPVEEVEEQQPASPEAVDETSTPTSRRKKKPRTPAIVPDSAPAPEEEEAPEIRTEETPKKKKVTKKPKPTLLKEFPFEGPLPLNVVSVKPEKVEIVKVEDLPLFAKIKLKKAPAKPKKEVEQPKVPKIHLKSRIVHHEWPPIVHHLTIADLEPLFVDNAVVSRNYEEAKKVKKTKRRKAKLPEKPETTLEKYEPYEEPPKQAEEPVPDQPGRVKDVKPKPKPIEPEQQKLVMGKGKVPQLEEEKEEVQLKKVPRKEPEEKPVDSKKPKQPKPEKPLPSEPGDDYSLKLKPLDDLPTSEGPGPDEMPIPQKDDDAPEEITTGKPKKSKGKPQKQPAPEEERKLPLGKGKPKPEPTEEDIKLRKKQGPPKEEEQEPIKLKPWKKDKPTPEDTPKDLEGPKPKPFPRDDDEDTVEPKTFDDKDKQKKKKPKPLKKLRPELIPMEVERFDVKPRKVEVMDVKDVPLFATIKLKKVSVEPKKVTEKPKVPKVLLKSRIKIMPAGSLVKHLVVTELEPIFVDNGIVSRNYEEAKKVKKTKRRKVMPQKPESVLEKFVPFVDESKQPVEEEPAPKQMPEPKPEQVAPEEDKLKLVMGKGKKLPEEETKEKRFRKKQGELPKEEPEEVKLKPWQKDKPEQEVEEGKEPALQQPQPEDSKERRKKLKLPLKKSEELTEDTLKVKKVQFELQQPVSPLPPRFIERIQPVISEAEQPVVFSCVFEGFPKPSITWSHNGTEVEVTEEVTVTVIDNVATLKISKVKKSDVGTYSCRASNPAGVATCTANLVIIEKQEAGEPPKFIKPLKPQIAKKGTLTELECTVTGLPTPQVTWYRANQEIVPDRLHNVMFSPETGKSVLTIVETTEIDEEIYAVRAVNKFGKAECRANLVLKDTPEDKVPEKLEPPKITKPLQAQVVPKESPVTLEAEFRGSPVLTVKWYRNGKVIEKTDEEEEIIEEETRTVLRIKRTTKKKTGKYEVRVTNKVGEARTSCTVKTIDIEEMEEMENVRAPRFIKPLKPTFVCEGEVVVMETLVESFPTCSFQWFIRDAPVTTRPDVRVNSEDNKSILVIEKITIEDTGEITCRAENVAGSVTSTASLQVTPESEVTELLSPTFLIKPQTAKVMDGESVLFTAKVVGQPTPQVKWFHNDKPIKEGKDKTIKQDEEGVCNLAIVEVFPEDSGVYTCVATNIAGEAIAATTLSVEAYEYVPDSEMATVTEVESSTLLSVRSESEEDLLGNKEMTTEAPDDFRTAPTFVTPLPQLIQATPGTVLRMLVKADGTPRPTIHWYKQGVELQPSEEFIIENLDDGTSVLTIPEIYPDDAGEIVCEAHNELGVTQTVAYVDLPEIMGTSLYKKPEWVVHMEEMQEKIKGKNMTMSTDSLEHECVKSEDESEYDSCCEELSDETEGEYETHYKQDSFYLLPPIEEKSEPSSSEDKSEVGKRSVSCADLSRSDSTFELRSRTFPRSKTTEEAYAREIGGTGGHENTLRRTLYPLEPRELDPESFHQLHTADSSEELQEFLLLESQCMDSDAGLAAAFLTSSATQAEPTFVKEITDSHVKTEETVVFDAMYAGNPQPVIIWYHNDKLLRASENVEITIRDNRSTVVIKRVKPESAGTYICKASSNIGEAISKAQVEIIGYGEVQEEEVQEMQETVVEKKEKKKKKRVKKVVTEEVERDSVDIEEVQPLESTAPFTETTETATAQRTFDIQESVAVSAVASCKKVSDEQEFPTDVPDVAGIVAPIQESVTITETIPGDEVVEMTVSQERTETASVTRSEQKSVSISQTVTQSTVSELVTESRTETRATESVEVLQTAQASRTTVSVSDIEETLEGLNVKEFGPWQAPLRELAKVDVLRKKGVSVEEVLTLYDTGELPALKTAPAQNALVSLVERVGHSSLISEMVTQEETLEDTLKGVLKAFLKMVELRHATVQETIALFRPRDFQTPHWETVSTMPVIAEETATETITETSQVEVQGTE